MVVYSLQGVLELIAICTTWLVMLQVVSTMYTRTIERFDHNDRSRFLMETLSRRRL